MARKTLLMLAATALPTLLLMTVGSGGAGASPIFPGNVTCNSTGGVWRGTITFTPPLFNGGTSTHELFKIKADLGNTTSPCVTTTTNPGIVIGKIKGALKFLGAHANSCATVFSGTALAPTAGRFVMKWTSPVGMPTHWKQPAPLSVTGAANMGSIAITGGTVTGSFVPIVGPTATLSDTSWPSSTGPVATGCASTGGLHSLALSPPTGTSTGTW
jgi:hypothetical protein